MDILEIKDYLEKKLPNFTMTKLPLSFLMDANQWLDKIVDQAMEIDNRDDMCDLLRTKFEEVFEKIK